MNKTALLLAIPAAIMAVMGWLWVDTRAREKETAALQAATAAIEAENRRKEEAIQAAKLEQEREAKARRAAEAAEAAQKFAKQQESAQMRAEVARDATAVEAVLKKFGDAHTVAQSTARIAVGTHVAAMQGLRRELESLKVHPCLRLGQVAAIDGMNEVIRGYLSFMERSSDAVTAKHFSEGAKGINQYRAMRDSCLRA